MTPEVSTSCEFDVMVDEHIRRSLKYQLNILYDKHEALKLSNILAVMCKQWKIRNRFMF